MHTRLFLDQVPTPNTTHVVAVVVPHGPVGSDQILHVLAEEIPAELTSEPLEAPTVAVALVACVMPEGEPPPVERIDRARHLLDRASRAGGTNLARIADTVAAAVASILSPAAVVPVVRTPALVLFAPKDSGNAPGTASILRLELAEDLDTWEPANTWAEIQVGALGATEDDRVGEVVDVDPGRRWGRLRLGPGEGVEFTRLADVRFPPREASPSKAAAEVTEETFAPPAEEEVDVTPTADEELSDA